MAQLAQRLGFDLTNPLTGHVELLADFLEGVIGVHVDTETHAQHLGLAGGQPAEHVAGSLDQALAGGQVDRQLHGAVLDEVAQVRVVVITDGRLHGDRLLGDLEHLAHLVLGHLETLAQFLRRRLATHLLQHLARHAVELVDGLDHVHRNPDGARLIGNRAGDRLTNPPGGVGRELVAAAVLELVHRLHQTDVALLDQVQELQPAVGVLLGDGDHQTQVGLDHLLLGPARLGLADGKTTIDLLQLRHGQLHHLLLEGDAALGTLNVGPQRLEALGELGILGNEFIEPLLARLVAGKRLDEALARHLGQLDEKLHHRLFLGANLLDADAHLTDQTLEVLGHQLDRREQFRQAIHLDPRLLAATTMLGQGFPHQLVLCADLLETRSRLFRIGTAGALLRLAGVSVVFVIVGIVGIGVVGVAVVAHQLFGHLGLGHAGDAFVRIDEAREEVGQSSRRLFVLGGIVGLENRVHRARQPGQRRHYLAGAFLDALGNLDLALAGQQLHGTHFTHVHAHRIGGPADVALHRRQGSHGLLGGRLVGGVIGHHQGIFIGRFLDDADTHVVDHADDVFHLIGIGNILGKMVVDLGIGQVALFLATRDQLLQT